MLTVLKFILYLMKDSKQVKFTVFSLKAESHFSFLTYFFFPQNNIKKMLYANVPEMSNSSIKQVSGNILSFLQML
jgi:hypothetical protein